MIVQSYSENTASEAIARTAAELSGADKCTVTVFLAPDFLKRECAFTGFANGAVQVRTDLLLGAGTSVQVTVGRVMVIFGTVLGKAAAAEDGTIYEVAVTTALTRRPLAA